ncbi:hypothetical protein G7K_0753-t1 [Saitoella complicata NRRL Y-17804]|uniref:Uncharacterized protein n=1 Tax=Saitoella complicata (strain BCRC 22490 / CBS 7301 / JCM 7358 / NBRC 10748 / NRRL Y-17804) TaxID=698492 RepID=A0A0E9N9Q3_SAICN|nr:hypothetical protein G7K_0753-t1 [Saitoella complicata NRRL Y-17804]
MLCLPAPFATEVLYPQTKQLACLNLEEELVGGGVPFPDQTDKRAWVYVLVEIRTRVRVLQLKQEAFLGAGYGETRKGLGDWNSIGQVSQRCSETLRLAPDFPATATST